jgi:hypothetical protein
MINGISCIFFAVWGLQISQKPNRRVTIWYLSTLVFMLILNISCYVKCENMANTVYQAINQYWSTMNENSRAMLQDFVSQRERDGQNGCTDGFYLASFALGLLLWLYGTECDGCAAVSC